MKTFKTLYLFFFAFTIFTSVAVGQDLEYETPTLPKKYADLYTTVTFKGYTLKYFPKALIKFLNKPRKAMNWNHKNLLGQNIGLYKWYQINEYGEREGLSIVYENGIPSSITLFYNDNMVLYFQEYFTNTKTIYKVQNGFFGSDGVTWYAANNVIEYYENNRLLFSNKDKVALIPKSWFNSAGIFSNPRLGYAPTQNDTCRISVNKGRVTEFEMQKPISDLYKHLFIYSSKTGGLKNLKTGKIDSIKFSGTEEFMKVLVNKKTPLAGQITFRNEKDVIALFGFIKDIIEDVARAKQ